VEAVKLVGPPGPTYRMAFPAFSAATPSREGTHHGGIRCPIADLLDERLVHLGSGAVREDHGQRREIVPS